MKFSDRQQETICNALAWLLSDFTDEERLDIKEAIKLDAWASEDVKKVTKTMLDLAYDKDLMHYHKDKRDELVKDMRDLLLKNNQAI